MVTLKASWQVRAGLIPGTPMPEYFQAWNYSSDHYHKDGNRRGGIFKARQDEAANYAAQLQNGGLNWVTLEYLWL